jgi:hypothetical protein
MKPYVNTERGSYNYVGLYDYEGLHMCRVAPLVLEAFVGPRPEGPDACHSNGISTDDRKDNLRWDTPKNNSADQKIHGTREFGEHHHQARLSESHIDVILAQPFISSKTLAERFSVHVGHINNIRRGFRWAHRSTSLGE